MVDAATQERGTAVGIKRRGVIAAAAALAAGVMAKRAMDAQPAEAATGGPLLLGNINTATGTDITIVQNPTASVVNQVFLARNFGVGTPPIPANRAVALTAVASTSGAPNAASFFPVGAYGIGAGTSGIGVLGQCDATTGIGVQGQSTGGVGVFGSSNGNAGVLGVTTASGNAGLGGITNIAGTAAFAGTSTNPSAFAGFFTGDVLVNGNFTVVDPTKKHGAIQHPDGSYRILYSMESPESWLEDFGEATLAGGKAEVKLDADFMAVVQANHYHVFLTPYDGAGGLRVVRRTGAGFAVEEIDGASNGAFSYRVVAKPKTTNKAARMAKFVIPEIKLSLPSAVPPAPAGNSPAASH
jgi:hypothetical protein